MKDSIKVAIAGATGYIGLELIKILTKHPKVQIIFLCAQKSVGKPITIFDKRIKSKKLPKISKIEKIDWAKVDLIFTALPNGESYKIALLKPSNVKLIDLSADFRLNSFKLYLKWYGINFKSNTLLKKSIYSLGIIKGTISDKKKGKNGFGYDPIFIPYGRNQTFGQMKPSKKYKIDHRFKAFKKIKKFF